MFVRYGAFTHEANLTSVNTFENKVRNPDGHGKFLINKRLSIAGAVKGTSEADLKAKIQTIEAAYAIEFQSGGLVHSDGATLSAHWLDNPSSYGGVRVNGINWGGTSKAEYVTFRSFTIELEADYTIALNTVISQTETVEILGTGGPRKGYVELLNAVAQSQIINAATLTRAVQSGSAVWTFGTHTIPDPIWPTLEDVDRRSLGRVTVDLNTSRFSRSWQYFFTNNGPFVFPIVNPFDSWTWDNGDNAVWDNGDNMVFNAV